LGEPHFLNLMFSDARLRGHGNLSGISLKVAIKQPF